MQRANDLASEHGNPELQPVHILAALLEDQEGIVAPLLERVGLHAASCAGRSHDAQIEHAAQSLGQRRHPGALSDAATQLLENAFKEAANFKDEFVSTEHLLLGIDQAEARRGAADSDPWWRNLRQHSAGADRGARQSEGDRPESRSEVSGAGALRQRPDGTGAPRQARSRSSAATRKCAVSSRCCRAGRRTIPC